MDGEERVIRWRCVFTTTIFEVLRARPGWVRADDSDDWQLHWATRDWMNTNFLTHRFADGQLVNHFRNDYEITRKDFLVKNYKRLRRQKEKEPDSDSLKRIDFLPASYILPVPNFTLFKTQDYHLFVEEFRSHPPETIWIMKPVSGAQGQGIFLFRKLKDITEWKRNDIFNANSNNVQSYVVQSYIANPYLISGKKFDMRIYVLVTSLRPLKAWLHREGFARFSHARYSLESIEDAYVHLTNVAVAKTAADYDPEQGLKWPVCSLRRYLCARHGAEPTQQLVERMGYILLDSLRCGQMAHERHCFELLGYDMLLDAQLKPWLLEVNASPSLTASSDHDRRMKCLVLSHMLDVLDLERKNNGNETRIGGFDLFVDGQPVLSTVSATKPAQHARMHHVLNVHLGQAYPEEPLHT